MKPMFYLFSQTNVSAYPRPKTSMFYCHHNLPQWLRAGCVVSGQTGASKKVEMID